MVLKSENVYKCFVLDSSWTEFWKVFLPKNFGKLLGKSLLQSSHSRAAATYFIISLQKSPQKRRFWEKPGRKRRSYHLWTRWMCPYKEIILSFTKKMGFTFVLEQLVQKWWILLGEIKNSEWIYNLYLPECKENPCLKQMRYLKFKWMQRDSNPQRLTLSTNTQQFSQTS